jgi:AcrR family transcriptional regulator
MATKAVRGRKPSSNAGDPVAVRDDAATPLEAVVRALKLAEQRGELTSTEIDWSVARLAGRVRRGNPRLEGVNRPEDILRAAAEVFRRRGYNHATIEEIAAELFLTKAGVYHYFSSKQEILEALCERAMASAEDAVKRGMDQGGTPDERLSRMFDEYLDAIMHQAAFSVLMRHLDEVSAPVLTELQRRRKEVEGMFRKVLEEGIRAGEFESTDSHVAVFGMIGAANWIYAWFTPDGRLSPEEVRETLRTMILNGVRARGRAAPR